MTASLIELLKISIGNGATFRPSRIISTNFRPETFLILFPLLLVHTFQFSFVVGRSWQSWYLQAVRLALAVFREKAGAVMQSTCLKIIIKVLL